MIQEHNFENLKTRLENVQVYNSLTSKVNNVVQNIKEIRSNFSLYKKKAILIGILLTGLAVPTFSNETYDPIIEIRTIATASSNDNYHTVLKKSKLYIEHFGQDESVMKNMLNAYIEVGKQATEENNVQEVLNLYNAGSQIAKDLLAMDDRKGTDNPHFNQYRRFFNSYGNNFARLEQYIEQKKALKNILDVNPDDRIIKIVYKSLSDNY